MTKRITQEQIENARQISVLDYLHREEANELKRIGGRYYTTKSHDSMRIDANTGKWFWNSRNQQGSNAIDYLMVIYEMTFIEAVKRLIGGNGIQYSENFLFSKSVEEKHFNLPQANHSNDKAIAYLMKRGIDRKIIEQCISEQKLYESIKYHACVFVGRNQQGEAKFASIRASKGRYKCDMAGSQKKYGFALEALKENNVLFVFEAPIDLLSHATIEKVFKKNSDWRKVHRLALGGVSTVALDQYLKSYPSINEIHLCLDNDEAGTLAASRIEQEWGSEGYKIQVDLPNNGIDYNESLLTLMR